MLIPNEGFGALINSFDTLCLQGIGCTKITKAKNEGSMNGNVESRAYLEKKLVFCFGSYVAAQLLLPFGEENILSSSELKQAQEVQSSSTCSSALKCLTILLLGYRSMHLVICNR